MATRTVFQASDLANRRRDFIDAGRAGEAVLRDTDGFALIMEPLYDRDTREAILSAALSVIRVESAMERSDVRASELPYPWLLSLDQEKRDLCLREFRDALSLASFTESIEPFRKCVGNWISAAQEFVDTVAARRLMAIPGLMDELEANDADPSRLRRRDRSQAPRV